MSIVSDDFLSHSGFEKNKQNRSLSFSNFPKKNGATETPHMLSRGGANSDFLASIRRIIRNSRFNIDKGSLNGIFTRFKVRNE